VLMPLSAVLTMVISVIQGTDVLTIHLIAGAGIILLSSILSALGDLADSKGK